MPFRDLRICNKKNIKLINALNRNIYLSTLSFEAINNTLNNLNQSISDHLSYIT